MNLRNLQLKQSLQKTWMCTGNHNLRSLASILDLQDISLETVIYAIVVITHLLVWSKNSFRPAKININILILNTVYNTCNNVIFPVLISAIYISTLSLSNTLDNGLLSCLSCNTAEILSLDLDAYQVSDLIISIDFLSLGQGNLRSRLSHLFICNYCLYRINMILTCLPVKGNIYILIRTVITLISSLKRFLNGIKQKLNRNFLYYCQFLYCLQEILALVLCLCLCFLLCQFSQLLYPPNQK